jgi:hypothetical protein
MNPGERDKADATLRDILQVLQLKHEEGYKNERDSA